jgi:hypothetical protein
MSLDVRKRQSHRPAGGEAAGRSLRSRPVARDAENRTAFPVPTATIWPAQFEPQAAARVRLVIQPEQPSALPAEDART